MMRGCFGDTARLQTDDAIMALADILAKKEFSPVYVMMQFRRIGIILNMAYKKI